MDNNRNYLLLYKIVWGAIAFSTGLCWISVNMVVKAGSEAGRYLPNFDSSLEATLTAFAVGCWFMSAFVPRFLAPRKSASSEDGGVQPPPPLQSYFPAFVVRLALIDAGALNGFVIAILAREVGLFPPFALFSLLLLGKAFPSSVEKIIADYSKD